mgnify:CR=1 FL=1
MYKDSRILLNTIFILFFFTYTYSLKDFDFDIFSDRDILRSLSPFNPLQIYGAELNLKYGNRVIGGFNYYFLYFIQFFTNNPFYIVYILFSFIILSFYYLLNKLREEISTLGACFALVIFFCLDSTIFQLHKLWNPTLGLPLSILGIANFFNYIKKKLNKNLFFSILYIFLASQFHSSYLFIIILIFGYLIFKNKEIIIKFFLFLICSIFIVYFTNFYTFIFNFENSELLIHEFITSPIFIKNETIKVTKTFSIYNVLFLLILFSLNFLLFHFRNILNFLKKNKKTTYFLIFLIFLIFLSLIITQIIFKVYGLKEVIIFGSLLTIIFLLNFLFFKIILNLKLDYIIKNLKYYLFGINLSFLFFFILTFKLLNLLYVEWKSVIFYFILVSFTIWSEKIKSNHIEFKKNEEIILTLSYFLLSILIFVNVIFNFTYNSNEIIFGNFTRYNLVLIPFYCLWLSYCLNIVFKNDYLTNKILVLFVITLFIINLVVTKFSSNGTFKYHASSFKTKKEIIDYVISNNELSRYDAFNNLGIVKITNKKNLQPLEGYQNILKNYKYTSSDKKKYCILIVSKYPTHNVLKLKDKSIIDIVKKDKLFLSLKNPIIETISEKKFIIVKYKQIDGSCYKSGYNDYIFIDKEIELLKKFISKDYTTLEEKINNQHFKYYLNINDNGEKPLFLMIEIKNINENLYINLYSKQLRNSRTELNGFWKNDFVKNLKIEIETENNLNSKKYLLNYKNIGIDLNTTPIFKQIKLDKYNKNNYKIKVIKDEIDVILNKELELIKDD